MAPPRPELAEMAAILNSTTDHSQTNESYAEAIKQIFVDPGDSFLDMLRRGRIYDDQVPHMVNIVEEDIELALAAEVKLPPSLQALATYSPGIRKAALVGLVQSAVDARNSEMALTGITGGAVPFMQGLAKKTGSVARKLVGGGD